MAIPPRSPGAAGGVFIAVGAIAGAFVGDRMGQPSVGLLAGFAVGAAIAGIVWLVQRRRG